MKQKKAGFFKRFFGADQRKKRAYRILKRELGSARIDLFRLKQDTISVPIVKIIYEIYRLTQPIRQLLQLEKTGKRFTPSFAENFILRFQLPEDAEIHSSFNEEFVRGLAAKHGLKQTIQHMQNLLTHYFKSFDHARVEVINRAYSNFLYFARFAHFDFFPIVREFDESLEEGNFLKKPSFAPAQGPLLRDELYQLHLALNLFTVDESIDHGIEALAEEKGITPISHHALARLKQLLKELQTNQYLPLIIRAIDKRTDPLPVRKPNVVDIFHSFSIKKEKEVSMLLNSMKTKYRDETVSAILSRLFDQDASGRIKNYTELKNDQLKTLGLPSFRHATPLNYCKAFLTDRYKPFIGSTMNELIVGGMFIDKKALTNLSNNYYALNDSISSIDELDDDLDIDGRVGKSIERLIQKAPKDRGMMRLLEKTIVEQNGRAGLIITNIITNSREMAITLRRILDDYRQKSPTIVGNIAKIRAQKNREFIEDLIACYRYLYLFLRLLGHYVSLRVVESTAPEASGNQKQEEKVPDGKDSSPMNG